jgi:glucose-1-phosphate adenylyltransferase
MPWILYSRRNLRLGWINEGEQRAMRRTVAVVLAGGWGRRMDILCYIRPKPGLFFAGWYRVIDFALSNCIYPEILDIAVLTDYERSHVAKHLKLWKQVNAPNKKLRILEAEAGSYKGTADAIYQNPDYLRILTLTRCLCQPDDHVYKMGYRRMLIPQQKASADVIVGVVRVPMEQAHRFGTATLDGVGKIVGFAEKTWTPSSSLVSTGIYALKTESLGQPLIEDAQQPDSPDDISYAIIPRMVNRDSVFAYQLDGYWHDIGNIEAYYTLTLEAGPQRLD